jgi:hypothetical protein
LLLSLLSLDGRADDVSSIYLERDVALFDGSEVQFCKPFSELEEDEQVDYLDDDLRLFILTSYYFPPQSVFIFVNKQTFSYTSIRAPLGKLI